MFDIGATPTNYNAIENRSKQAVLTAATFSVQAKGRAQMPGPSTVMWNVGATAERAPARYGVITVVFDATAPVEVVTVTLTVYDVEP